MSGKQTPKRFRTKPQVIQFNPYSAMRKLSDALFEDEVGCYAIRRHVSDANLELFDSIGTVLAKTGAPAFNPPKKMGLTIMKKSEIDTTRRHTASRLGGFSFAIAREIIKDMLPESGASETKVTIDRFILSKPKGGRRYLIASLVDIDSVKDERLALETGIDAFDKVTNEWPAFQPHITLGSYNERDVTGRVFKTTLAMKKEFGEEIVVLEPAV